MSTKDYRLEEFENCTYCLAYPYNRYLGSIAKSNLESKNSKLGYRFIEIGLGKGNKIS
jgi:hypothetical protein